MQYIEQAPPDAQKALIRALIKEIIVYEDQIEIKMYIDQPAMESLSCTLPAAEPGKPPQNEKRPTDNCKALVPLHQAGLVRLSVKVGCPSWTPDEPHNLKYFT